MKEPEGQLARWLEKLAEYEFGIIHRPSRLHTNADSFSRRPCRQSCPCNLQDPSSQRRTTSHQAIQCDLDSDTSSLLLSPVGEYFTKWTKAFAIPDEKAVTVANVVATEWVCRFGMPHSLHSNQGRNFESEVFQEMCCLFGIDKTHTTPFRPQSAVRFNATLQKILASTAEHCHWGWDLMIPYAVMAYRVTKHSATGFTPNFMMFGREISEPVDLVAGLPPDSDHAPSAPEYVQQMRERLNWLTTSPEKPLLVEHCELEEMQEQKEALQSKVTALENELNRTSINQFLLKTERGICGMLCGLCSYSVELSSSEHLYMMKSFQLSYFQLLYLLTAALLCKGETERPCKQVHQLNISHLLGDSMSISCQTTTHPLDSLTVKLRSMNQDKVILMSLDISPASEHQRWSVRNDTGNVTLDLKDFRSSDSGLYDCQVYKNQDCLQTTRFNLSIIKCKPLNPVHARLNSSVLLPCSEHPLQNRTAPVTWKVVNGHELTDITQYRAPFKPSSSTEKPPDPLYMRAKQLNNGSLLINNAVQTDELWYRCRVNEKTCYEMKLVMKDKTFYSTISTTLSSTVITHAPTTAADKTAGQTTTKNNESETYLTVVAMTTVVSLCVLISLTICVILYFPKQSHKTNSQIDLNCWTTVHYSIISGGFDGPFCSLDEHNV
ncbi:uncharacterized protein LOC113099377 [Carassius auratus]|uniref:Uncharacterized protein LOC113099377 n=1 Tax=Carassius auratus TaxID=7957 RepID=A0A6P6PHC2_CARAU|nr:uncharacterized protein LOC113099377 [Carassius auratus]